MLSGGVVVDDAAGVGGVIGAPSPPLLLLLHATMEVFRVLLREGKAAKENGLAMSTSRVSGSGEVCGRAPLAIVEGLVQRPDASEGLATSPPHRAVPVGDVPGVDAPFH